MDDGLTPADAIEKRLHEYPYGGDNSAQDFINAIDSAGYVIVPKIPTIRMGRIGEKQFAKSTYATGAQRMNDAYRAMIASFKV